MYCPKCDGLMSSVPSAADGLVVRCGYCAGILCDEPALVSFERHWFLWPQSGTEDVDVGEPKSGRRGDAVQEPACPGCGVRMIRVAVPDQEHIELDRCNGCGLTYFDAGEMTDFRYRTLADWLRDWLHASRHRGAG